MDFIQELIQESSNMPPAAKALPKVEPIYGMPTTLDPAASGSTLNNISGVSQVFIDPVAAAPVTPVAPAAPVVQAASVEQVLSTTEKTQKFSCYNPMGEPPAGLRPSESCLKCRYFESHYDDRGYAIDPSGHCEQYDFAVRGGYVCDSFQSLKAYRAELEAEYKAQAAELTVFAEPQSKTVSVSDIEKGIFKQSKPEVVEPQVLAEPAVVVSEPEKKDVEKKETVEYSDKELYSEAIERTKFRFKTPDSPIAQSYCNQRYKRLYATKYGSLKGAFSDET